MMQAEHKKTTVDVVKEAMGEKLTYIPMHAYDDGWPLLDVVPEEPKKGEIRNIAIIGF